MVFGLCYFLSFFAFVFAFAIRINLPLPCHAQSQPQPQFMCWHCVNKYKTDQQWKYIVCIQKRRRSFYVRMKQVHVCVLNTHTHTHCIGGVRDFFPKCSYKSICMMSIESEMLLYTFIVFIWLHFFTLFPFFHSSFCMSRSDYDCSVCYLFEFGALIVCVEFILSP